MLALGLGLMAALAWGVHDLLVRSVSRRADVPACLLGVFSVGLLLLLPALAWQGARDGALELPPRLLVNGAAIGTLYALANYTLYRAFAAGPVRIVAPVTASYPVYTVALSVAGGASVAIGSWIAVFAVVAGVALVAFRSDPDERPYALRAVLGWSVLASLTYAGSFSFGQHLSGEGDTVVTLVVTRAFALVSVLLFMLGSDGLRLPPRETWPAIAVMAAMDALSLALVFGAGNLPDAALATVTASLFGIVTIVLARFVFGELLSMRQWSGVALAFAAIGWLGAA